MNFSVLGPVRVSHNEVEILLGGSKQRTVLASLLLHDNHVLSNDRLTELLWDFNPPATASAQIHTYMSRLRIKLSPHARIIRQHQGYTLQTNGSWVDFREFNALAEQAHNELAGGRYDVAAERFRTALNLWQGPALADCTPFLTGKVGPAWEEVRMAALEGRINADLHLGLHASLVPELTALVWEYPYHEVLRAYLMTALYFCNRQADALAVYQDGRRILVEEVGVDPGEALVRTHLAVLRGHFGSTLLTDSRRRTGMLLASS